jgi:hypothetical protein
MMASYGDHCLVAEKSAASCLVHGPHQLTGQSQRALSDHRIEDYQLLGYRRVTEPDAASCMGPLSANKLG